LHYSRVFKDEQKNNKVLDNNNIDRNKVSKDLMQYNIMNEIRVQNENKNIIDYSKISSLATESNSNS